MNRIFTLSIFTGRPELTDALPLEKMFVERYGKHHLSKAG